MPRFSTFLPALLSALVGTSSLSLSAPADGPDAGGLNTEPGLRLRVFWIGKDFDTSLPLQPGQSPNVDRTVPRVAVEAGTVFRDTQEISDKAEAEAIRHHYLAEWSGWLKAPVKGSYTFLIETNAATSLILRNQTINSPAHQGQGAMTMKVAIELEAGWQPIRLVQKVVGPTQQAITLSWIKPDDGPDDLHAYIEPDFLRAPKFYYRPTQLGKKRLSDGEERPGLGRKLTGVHPGYHLTCIRPGGMEMPVGGLGMLPDGRLAVARFDAQTLRHPDPTEEPNGELWLITNPTSDDPSKITGEKIAEGLFEPSGLKVLGEDIYVSQRNEISKFRYDKQSDTWLKSVIASGWETNDFHQISAGLPWEPGPTASHPGFFYMSRGAGLGKNRNPPNHASVWKIDLSKPAGQNVEVLTGGHRTPNGLGLNATGDCFVVDNQGHWTPANEINHVQKGHFYGFHVRNKPPMAHPTPFQPDDRNDLSKVTPAAIQLPQDEIANSPTELLLFPKGHRFEGQMAIGDMRYGGVNRVFLEKVGGVWQGCAMRFTQGLEAGPNRLFFGPDGSLYVGGIGGRHAGTWFWVNPKTKKPTFGGLERLSPSGEKVFEIESMQATPSGFLVNFTQRVDPDWLREPTHYELSQWTYRPTRHYGGPKIDEQELRVQKALPAKNGRSVVLVVPNLKQGYVVRLTTNPVSTLGQAIWSGEVWYTLNRIPK